jgi:hypothetical protein
MNRTCKFAAVIGMGLALASCTVFAQEPAAPQAAPSAPEAVAAPVIPPDQRPTREQLAKLFDVMRVKEQLASMTKMMPTLMQQEFAAQFKQMQKDHPERAPMTEEQQQASAKVMSKFMGRVMNLYTSDEMTTDMTSIYQKHLTWSDVDGMIAFYGSPAGQHMLDIVPVIMKEFMPVVMQRMQERIKPLTDEMTKEMEETTKSSSPAADKPAQK